MEFSTLNGYKVKDKKAIRYYDTVALMKADTTLKEGQHVKTKGYYQVGDGGSAEYIIVANSTTLYFQETLQNNLYANLKIEDVMNTRQFGAKGDNSDETNILISALKYANNLDFVNGIYSIKGFTEGDPDGSWDFNPLKLKSNQIVDLKGSTINIIPNDRSYYHGFRIQNCDNVVLKNGTLIGDIENHTGSTGEFGYGITISGSTNVKIINMKSHKMWGDGINISGVSHNVDLDRCICEENRRLGLSITNGYDITVTNSEFNKTGTIAGTDPKAGVDIEPTGPKVDNIIFDNCRFNQNYNSGININGNDDAIVEYVTIKNSEFINNQANSGGVMIATKCRNCKFINNKYINDELVSLALNPINSIEFEGNYFENIYTMIRFGYANNLDIIYKNNHFKMNVTHQWTDLINMSTSNSITNGNNFIFENNIVNDDKDENGYSRCCLSANKYGFKKILIKNNRIFSRSRYILNTSTNCIIENNNFIGSVRSPIILEENDDSYVCVNNNVFEKPSFDTSSEVERDIIANNAKTTNIIATNNIVYKGVALNSNENTILSGTSGPVAIVYNSTLTGLSNISDNVIVSQNS